jgi:phosphoserine phosphatase
MIGFDENRDNTLLADGDKPSGSVTAPILGGEAKLATLVELRARFGLDLSDTLAIGDGANDFATIEASGLGVASHAKPKSPKPRIDLTALLCAQGYSRTDFIA